MTNKTVYVRVNQRTQSERFFRCAMEFSRAWRAVEVDEATLQRLHEEQMLEVSDTVPDDFVDATAATESAAGADASGSADADAEQRLAAIRAAIGQLDAKDATLWTSGGKAKVEAISAITGFAVTASERDAALVSTEGAK